MNKSKKLKAFSLIELSVVVLIIGLLIAAVIGGRKLVTISNLSKAKALTNSSPVAGIEDLSLWLESTSKNSFSVASPTDGTAIGTWFDINPQKTIKYNATEATNQPDYTASAINGLPAVTFNGTNDKLVGTISISGTEITFFIVAKRNAVVDDATTITVYNPAVSANDFDNVSSVPVAYEGTGGVAHQTYRNGANLSTVTNSGNNKPYIFTSKFDGTNNTVYLNGVGQTAVASAGVFNTTNYSLATRYNGGALTTFYNGSIGEIIVYNRALSDFERNQIEVYLSKKWGIKLT